jgi:hypothetical protein
MDQQPERRSPHRLGLERPALERPIGRAVEGKQRLGAEALGERPDRPLGPAVQGLRADCRVDAEGAPERGTRVADQEQRAGVGRRPVVRARMKAAAQDQTEPRQRLLELLEQRFAPD